MTQTYNKTYLSPVETEVLLLMSNGYSQKEIAKIRRKAISTIKFQCHQIYLKLDVPNAQAAVARALREGIIE